MACPPTLVKTQQSTSKLCEFSKDRPNQSAAVGGVLRRQSSLSLLHTFGSPNTSVEPAMCSSNQGRVAAGKKHEHPFPEQSCAKRIKQQPLRTKPVPLQSKTPSQGCPIRRITRSSTRANAAVTAPRTNASQAASLQPVQGEPATQQSDSSRGSDSVATNPAKPLPVLSESDPVIAAPVPASSTGVASITQTKPPNNTGNGPFTSATSSIPTPSIASPKSPRPVQLSKNLTPQSLHRRVYFAESSLQDSYKHYRDLFHEHQKLKAQLDDSKRQLKELDREWECRMSKAWVVLRAKSEGD
ncbi:MAG: hypothetical protein Q9162_000308 [Coniocarpon cinnabarinum]